jgi:hypothetical protein
MEGTDMLKQLVAFSILGALALTADASQLVRLDVDLDSGVYEVHVEMEFDAPAEYIRYLLTDFENLGRLNASITGSEIIRTAQPDVVRVRTEIRNCFLFFCTKIQKVEDVSEDAAGRIISVIDPGTSNFRNGMATWEISGLGNRSRVIHHARLEPDIWVPPWIGTAILKDALRREIRNSFENIDDMSRLCDRERLIDEAKHINGDFTNI